MKSISDNELVYMLREPATRREGFSAMVQQYSEQLYWKVRHIVLTHEDANDVLQNVFLKAWKIWKLSRANLPSAPGFTGLRSMNRLTFSEKESRREWPAR